eukprot:snap_masked-scaffold_11-processed-gene-1.15-mRNA-1 protein AED:1.00 eAED:1.00 QI:0/-1/0/0/-1/1/1/0/124
MVQTRRNLQLIQFIELKTYMGTYKKLFAEYRMFGATPERSLVEDSIRKIPHHKLGGTKFLCVGNNLDVTMQYYLKVESKLELRFNCPKFTEMIKHGSIQINKASLDTRKNPFRCLNCGGYGHAR